MKARSEYFIRILIILLHLSPFVAAYFKSKKVSFQISIIADYRYQYYRKRNLKVK